MASWASIAKASPEPVVAAQDLSSSSENLRLLVVDANAIIAGIKLEGIADRAVTIQEVMDEIRDKQSRQFLSTLPYKLQLSKPTEESLKAGERVFQLIRI
jgi:RNA-binding protein NOB1